VSLRELASKASLRAIIAVLSLVSLIAIVFYIIIRSDIRITVTGSIDVAQVITAFLSIIAVVIGWLFGSKSR